MANSTHPDDSSTGSPPQQTGDSSSSSPASDDSVETTVAAATPSPAPVDTVTTEPNKPTVVFVQAPVPPKKRGARGVGVLVTLLGAGVFAAAYALLVLLIALVGSPTGLAPAFQFFSTVTFFVPVIVFFFAYLLLVIIVNRSGWWAHVLGGFIVAVVVWISFVGAAIIAAGAFGGSTADVNAVVLQQLTSPLGFAAAMAAREVPIWVGGLVSRRGRSARARNAEARTAYEQELAEHRATLSSNTAV